MRIGIRADGFLSGGPGPDTLIGGDAQIGDSLRGGSGPDLIRAGGGADHIGGPGPPGDGDVVLGGPGQDVMNYGFTWTALRVSLVEHRAARLDGEGLVDRIFGIEDLAGSERADVLIGSAGPNTLVGQGGDDDIFGRGGTDLLLGDGGDDFLDGGAPGNGGADGPDLLFGRSDFDTCINGNAFGETSDDDPSCEVTDDTP